jgi:hypothetical protein
MQGGVRMANMKACGSFSPCGLNTGGHRNTNVYMDASKSAWLAPGSDTRGSAEPAEHWTAGRQQQHRAAYERGDII